MGTESAGQKQTLNALLLVNLYISPLTCIFKVFYFFFYGNPEITVTVTGQRLTMVTQYWPKQKLPFLWIGCPYYRAEWNLYTLYIQPVGTFSHDRAALGTVFAYFCLA